MWKLLFVLAFLTVSAKADTVVMNQMFDQLLNSVRALINKAGMNEMHVPDMKNDWHYRWHFVKLSGHANCHDGWVKSLASIQRTGDVTMSTQGNQAILRVRLGLGDLEFGFRKCQFKAKHLFSLSSKVDANVGSNSIDLQVSLTGQGAQCVAAVDHIVLDKLGGIKVHTGGGIIHKIENKIVDWMAKHFHGKIVKIINDKLAETARKSIPKLDLCSKIPH